MNTSVAVLAEGLENDKTAAAWRSPAGHSLNLAGVRLWSGNEPSADIRKDVLWACEKPDATKLASAGVPIAVACSADEDFDALADSLFSAGREHADVLAVRFPEGANELANVLLGQKERLDSWDLQLVDAIIARRPLQDILEIGVRPLANPVAVFDETSGLMSYAGDISGNYQGTIWEDVLDEGRAPVGYYSASERAQITAKIGDAVEPTIIRPKRAPEHENLSLSICEGSQILGTIAQVDLDAPFSCAQISLAMHLRDRLAEVFRTAIAGRHHRSPIGHTLRLLIMGDDVEEHIAVYQLERKGWHIDDRYCLIVAQLPQKQGKTPYSGPYQAEAEMLLPDPVVIEHDGYLVALVHLEQSEPTQSRDKLIETLRQRLDKDIPCGVSEDFEFLRARDAWRQARIAVREGGGNGRGGVSTFEEMFYPTLLHQMEQNLPLGVTMDPTALRISQSDRGDELLSCIFAYVMNGCNVSRAARALYMHRNTLEYRMGAIRKVWGLDMDSMDEDELLRLALSCRLLMEVSLES